MNAPELALMLADRVEDTVRHLLPNAKRKGSELVCGNIRGDAGESLSICLTGSKRGVWKDFAATGPDAGGDLLDLWAAVRGQTIAEAMVDVKRYLGVRDEMPARERKHYSRPSKPKVTASKGPVLTWLASRGLTEATAQDFKIAELAQAGKTFAVFPYLRDGEYVNGKYRNIADKRDMRQEAGAEPCLYGWQLIDPRERAVAICEGEIDCMTLHQMGIPALSVNAGAKNYHWIENDWERLECFTVIYLCFDADEVGQEAAREVANRLGLERTRLVYFGTAKDANEYLMAGATRQQFHDALNSAKTIDPAELRTLKDYQARTKALFYPAHDAPQDPLLTLCGMSQPFVEFRKGELTVWSGYNGHGKSLLLGQVLIGLLCQGERACVFSGEMKATQQAKRLVKQITGLDRPSPEYLDHVFDWLDSRMWVFDLVGTATIDRLIEVFRYARKRYGVTQFVIDSLMTTDVQEDGPGAITSQKEAVRKLVAFAKEFNAHVHLVAHPRKGISEKTAPGKLDVAGSGKITDAADNVFCVWSAQKQEDEPDEGAPDALLELHKQRNGEVQHKKLWLWFNRASMQFFTSPHYRERGWSYVNWSGDTQGNVIPLGREAQQ